MKVVLGVCAAFLLTGCAGEPDAPPLDSVDATDAILAVNEAMVDAMVAGTSTSEYQTPDWRGVNLNGTPMSAAGFEGEERTMQYDSIEILDRDVRVYGQTAALRWHANFFVQVDGQSSFAEMRLLDVYVLRDGRWVMDLTQVTPVYGTVGNPPGN